MSTVITFLSTSCTGIQPECHISHDLNLIIFIAELRAEIDKLRSATGVVSDDVISSSLAEITSLREKLLDKEREMDEMTKYVMFCVCMAGLLYAVNSLYTFDNIYRPRVCFI